MANNDKIKTSFERMKQAVCEVVKEELDVNMLACKSHTSSTLKVVAIPGEINVAEIYVPYQIFVGARTDETCIKWSVEDWKVGLRGLCLEIGVKDCPRTRLMSKKIGQESPRVYANHFWGKIESMSGWNVALPEFPKAQTVGAELLENAAKSVGENTTPEKAHNKSDVQRALEMMGLKFCCM